MSHTQLLTLISELLSMRNKLVGGSDPLYSAIDVTIRIALKEIERRTLSPPEVKP